MRSDRKGKSGEREVCKLLMLWWTPHYPGSVFVKTPGSGGWGGASRFHAQVKSDIRASGDVMTTLDAFPFSVEVKREQHWSPDRMLFGRPSPVWTWWIQAQTQACKDYLIPMLWFRRNREPWWVLLPVEYAKRYPLPPPMQSWSRGTLLGVDHGALVPVLYEATVLMTVNPTIFEGHNEAEVMAQDSP